MRRALLINLLAFIFASAIIFALYEVYLRINYASTLDIETVVDLPIYESSFPLSWAHKSDVEVGGYFGEPITLNEFGHRDEVKDEAEKNVLLLGDEFVFGVDVGQSKIFSFLMDSESQNVDFMNGGVYGYALDQYLTALNETEFEMDAVVMFINVQNDVVDMSQHKILSETDDGMPGAILDKRRYVSEDSILRTISGSPGFSLAWNEIREFFGWENMMEAMMKWSVFLKQGDSDRLPEMEELWDDSLEYLEVFKNELDRRGVEFLVVLVPADVQVSKDYWDKYPNMLFDEEAFIAKRPQTRFSTFFNDQTIDYLDLLPIFEEDSNNDQIYFVEDPYWTEYGHGVVADVILDKVQNLLE